MTVVADPIEEIGTDPNRVYEVPMGVIFHDDDFNCRGIIDPVDVLELARDIKKNGLSQPIVIQPWDQKPGKRFRIVAGHRRFKAHVLNEAETIRALVRKDLTDLQARVLNLSENVQRKDLNILQEALAINHFKRASWGEQMIAQSVGMSRGWVQVRLMLLELPEEIKAEAAAGLFTQEQIRQIHHLGAVGTVEDQFQYVRNLKDKKLKGIKKDPKITPSNSKRVRDREDLFALQDIIREVFGNNQATRVIAFAAGEIDDSEMHSYNFWAAKERGLDYIMPEGVPLREKNQV